MFNNTGVLLFSKNLKDIYQHTEISCALFKGTGKRYVLDRKIFNSDLITNVNEALVFLEKHLRLAYKFTGDPQREEILELPKEALREALINAVTHRDYFNKGPFIMLEIYDDRVEISNFGGLPKGLTEEELGTKSVPRNHLIAEFMRIGGYIERMGSGIKTMRDLMDEEELEPIQFKFTNFTTVTFYRKLLPRETTSPTFVAEENSGKSVNNRKRNALNEALQNVPNNVLNNVPNNVPNQLGAKGERLYKLLKILENIDTGMFSPSDFANKQGSTLRTVKRDLKSLKEKGFILVKGKTKAAKYKVIEKYKKLKKKL